VAETETVDPERDLNGYSVLLIDADRAQSIDDMEGLRIRDR
jgi:hypothetical protein